jgi:hypothetical protein
VATSSGSERIRTTSAVSIATFGAGADGDANVGLGESGRVVDAVANHRDLVPPFLQLLDHTRLVTGEDFSHDLVDAELRGDPLGGLAVVAGKHDRADVLALEGLDRGGRGFPGSVGDGDQGGCLAVDRDLHDGAASPASVAAAASAPSSSTPSRSSRRPFRSRAACLHGGERSMAGHRFERLGLGPVESALLGCSDDRLGERMLALAFGGRDQPQHVAFVHAVGGRHRYDLGLTTGERAGLVEDDRFELRGLLDRNRVLERSAPGTQPVPP